MLLALLGVLALVVPPTTASADGTGGAQHRCRGEWADLTSLHGENGNPLGPVPELDQRWDATYAAAASYADTATVDDCGAVIEAFAATWGHLESFQYALYRYDPMGRLGWAEGDRRHALHFWHVKHLSPELERAFRVARRQAPRAAADLAPALAPAATVDVDDQTGVAGVLAGLRSAAHDSRHLHRLNQVLRMITNAELDEE
jgi:hypothetical protein